MSTNNTFKRHLYNFNWLLLEKIVYIIVGVFITAWVARYLGPDNFGILNYAIAYSGMFALFANLGLDKIVVRELVKHPSLENKLLGTVFVLKLCGSFIAVMAIAVSLFIIDVDNITRFVVFITASGFVIQSVDVIDYFYQSKVLSKYITLSRSCAFFISSGLKVFLILEEYDVIYFALANLFFTAISSYIILVVYKRNGNKIKSWQFDRPVAKKLFKYSWPLAVSTFLVSVHMRVDQLMIGNMLAMKQVGFYSVAVRLSEYWIFIPGIIVSTLMPYFTSIRDGNNKFYKYRLMQLYSFMFWLGVVFVIFIMLIGKILLSKLFGNNYLEAYPALVILLVGMVLRGQSLARSIWIINENLQFYIIFGNFLAAVANIMMNLYLIPKYGILGAASSTVITIIINNWVTPVFIVKAYRENTIDSIKAINPMVLLSIANKKHLSSL